MDDLLLIGSSLDVICDFKREMATKFQMSDLGSLTSYLGIEVTQLSDVIFLKQERYATKIQEEAGMRECNTVDIPMDPGLKLSKAPKEKGVNERELRNIECLKYLIHTRPDLVHIVGVLSRYMHEPKESHRATL